MQIIQKSDLTKIAEWLFGNAKNMDKTMFFNSRIDWSRLETAHILALRAFAPDGVFDNTSEAGYLTRVGDNPELAGLSSYIFKDDYQFVNGLPEELKNQMIQLIQMVYRAKIRKADNRVKAM